MLQTKKIKHVCVIAGDPSGDVHGAHILIDLKRRSPDLKIFGIGGNYMAREGMELIFHNRNTAFMGFAEVIKHLGFIRNMFQVLEEEIEERRPDAIILIDYPGFNLKLAEKIHHLNIPVFYYIAPQAWAWKENRVKLLKKYVKHLFVIFPFEEPFFSQFKIPTTFVGHPFGHSILNREFSVESLARFGINPDFPLISFLPGSREQELKRHLPVIKKTVNKIKEKYPHWQIAISKAPMISTEFWLENMKGFEKETYNGNVDILLSGSTTVAVASGTASLQVAFHKKPMVIFYKVSSISYLIARSLTRLKYIGMINILNGSELFPELIQHKLTAESLLKKIEDQIFNYSHQPIKMAKMKQLIEKLFKKDSSRIITDTMLEVMNKKES
ncbi:MAG: lipid-A-disaccharide synthase [Candidatus Marinimicrobia bacterium]|nr:lipid-A-disaccharide synthase [Candidatus Neomarinimicrobiota bacterium]